jgi:hypothetical protein
MDIPTYNSLELRWFMPGVLPDRMYDWFQSGPREKSVEHRTDTYWLVPRTDVGVKRRNGGPVEMKVRRSARPWLTPSGDVVCTEQWSKWRPHRLDPGDTTGAWVAIDKRLWTRTFTLSGEEVHDAVDGRRPRCEVELGALTSETGTCWTFAFEVTGPARLQPPVLGRTVERFWSGDLEGALGGATNAGYPEWLASPACLSGCV